MRRAGQILAAAAAVGVVLVALADPAAAARGWLAAFLLCAAAVIGAVALSLVAGLTGAAPGLVAAWAPAAATIGLVYPWATVAPHGGHAAEYLQAPLVLLRDLAAVVIWAVIGWQVSRGRGTRIWLGLSLLVHAVLVIIVGVDWVLSLQPGWMSSNFGMNLAAQQIAAGAAVAILAGGAPRDRDLHDLVALVLAGVFGVAYLAFMDYLVVWYGNLPDRVTWYLDRSGTGARAVVVAALVIGAAAPAGLAAAPRLGSRSKPPLVAGCALAGLALYQIFLLLPVIGALTLLAAALALVFQGLGLFWVARRGAGALLQEATHG